MADEKEFAPTAARLRKARAEGDVARSSEVCAVAACAAAVMATAALGGALWAALRLWLASAARLETTPPQQEAVAAYALAPLAAAAGAAIAAAALQTRGLTFALRWSLAKCNPLEGFKRMCSREAAITAVRSVIAVSVAAVALAPAVGSCVMLANGAVPIERATAALSGRALRIVGTVLALGAVFAAIDYAVVRASFLRRMRMSYDDIKRDTKEEDGDPHARARRSALHRSFVSGSIERVKDAAFVITNPTHVAVALDYRPPEVMVPVVLVRAVDDGALRVRALAREHGVPIVESPQLARSLLRRTRAGETIPRELYVPVAQIVAALLADGEST